MNQTEPTREWLQLRRSAIFWALLVALLWLIHALAVLGDWDRAALAVRPREWSGLIGLLTAPLVHGSASHLLSNSLPLVVIGVALGLASPRSAPVIVAIVWIGAGLGVWLLGRDAAHLGASGLAYGMMFYVLFAGILHRDRRSVALVLIVLFLHGGMIWGVVPLREGVSFESHLSGAVVGAVCAFALRERGRPQGRPRKYAWEGKAIDEEHPAADLFVDERED